MGLLGSFDIAGSGLYTHRRWMDALSDNIANINTVRPTSEDAFQERFVEVQAQNMNNSGGGVGVQAIRYGSAEGVLRYEPDNPMADEEGFVRAPDISLADQMSNMILAQRGYQASAAAVERARAAYEAALTIGVR